MKIYHEIRKNTYYDSVTLMLISKEIKKMEDIEEALVGMGTDLNKELAKNLELSTSEIDTMGPNDFFIAIGSENDRVMEAVSLKVNELLNRKNNENTSDYRPSTLNGAIKYQPDSNLAIISVPGTYAPKEAKDALMNNLHVMLFSDNISIKEERELKELAVKQGLLMMGPDCGTAIINHVPLAFANVIKGGTIGVVGASGTGIQEVTVLIDHLGEGASQVIGTGGRDLKNEIGGLMMLQGIEALKNDSKTTVIVLISKPPAPEIAEKVLKAVETSQKPVVVHFIGGNQEMIKKYGAYPCHSLEDAAYKAVALSRGKEIVDFQGFSLSDEKIEEIVEGELKKLDDKQIYLRGLYTGGTLADEGMKLMGKSIPRIFSNIPLDPQYNLDNPNTSKEHTIIDLGEDTFTLGRPHPMIDPITRIERLDQEVKDDEVAIILMDFVLGYGSHSDPIGEMLPSIKTARDTMLKRGRHITMIASICGTDQDPQGLKASQERLAEAGVIVMPSNAQAVRLAIKVLEGITNKIGGF